MDRFRCDRAIPARSSCNASIVRLDRRFRAGEMTVNIERLRGRAKARLI